jgi:hypothetical protein
MDRVQAGIVDCSGRTPPSLNTKVGFAILRIGPCHLKHLPDSNMRKHVAIWFMVESVCGFLSGNDGNITDFQARRRSDD